MSESTDIVLINPSNKKMMFRNISHLAGVEPPLWTGLLAAYVRGKGFSVHIIDADAEGWGPEETVSKILKLNPQVVGIGAVGANPSASSTPKMPAARSILKSLKEKKFKAITLLYGIHPAALPERTLKEESVDFVCRGEALVPVAEMLTQLKEGTFSPDCQIKGIWYKRNDKIVDNGWADQIQDLDSLPFIAWDLLPMHRYAAHTWHCYGHINQRSPYAIIFTSLGCIFNCSYCNIHGLYAEKPGMRYRSPQNVIEEIDYLVKKYKIRNFKFLDELFVMGVSEKHNKRMNEICDLLIERNYDLNIWVYARIDTVNPEILAKLRKAGVTWICYGIEGGNKEIRTAVSKGQFDSNGIAQAVKWTRDAEINIIGNFMFGLPNDTVESMQETLDLAKTIRCEYANFYCTMAYPGSQLYRTAVEQGLELPKVWMGYSQYGPETFPLPTKHLKPKQILQFRDTAFMEYYTDPEYLALVEKKFGKETLEHIKEMTSHKIHRNLLANETRTMATFI